MIGVDRARLGEILERPIKVEAGIRVFIAAGVGKCRLKKRVRVLCGAIWVACRWGDGASRTNN